MPEVHGGTTALKNVEAQDCSKAHYINRKIPIDFSGLRSQTKLGLEPNSLSRALAQSFTPDPAAPDKS